ncbi:hypothetical protein INT44_004447 [Umbelopsis vinacea]|uniref:Uncharacterized protein n=1 Tax=Umbelopsis vinacea TaxID=44442 RepID=A0A8H7UN43_9FUNG|nr:hypothetical protein INT44_004447 [Umbelopsis vinacea]KAI9284290.1 hypothetical protein BC943DRAFT_326055 [Umbelopsis sp. AD052]
MRQLITKNLYNPAIRGFRSMTRIVPTVETKGHTINTSLWPEEEDYKPFGNEYSSSGTTYETTMSMSCGNKTVDPALEMKENESTLTTNPNILTWSAANLEISDLEGERILFRTTKSEILPSFHKHHPDRPEPQVGLFKPLRKPNIKRLD